MRDKFEHESRAKDRENNSVLDKIQASNFELKKLRKRNSLDHSKEQSALAAQMDNVKDNMRDLKEEIKTLRKLQYHQSKRLFDLDGTENYPEKIKQLLQEKKFAGEKLKDT